MAYYLVSCKYLGKPVIVNICYYQSMSWRWILIIVTIISVFGIVVWFNRGRPNQSLVPIEIGNNQITSYEQRRDGARRITNSTNPVSNQNACVIDDGRAILLRGLQMATTVVRRRWCD